MLVKKKKKKGNRDSILNLSKSKRKIITLLSVDDNIFIFLSYGTLVVHIWIRDGCSAIMFLKHLHPSFVSTVHNAVRMHELLLCCESSRKCYHAAQTTPTWTKTILTGLQIYCCACSHPWPKMNEQCSK